MTVLSERPSPSGVPESGESGRSAAHSSPLASNASNARWRKELSKHMDAEQSPAGSAEGEEVQIRGANGSSTPFRTGESNDAADEENVGLGESTSGQIAKRRRLAVIGEEGDGGAGGVKTEVQGGRDAPTESKDTGLNGNGGVEVDMRDTGPENGKAGHTHQEARGLEASAPEVAGAKQEAALAPVAQGGLQADGRPARQPGSATQGASSRAGLYAEREEWLRKQELGGGIKFKCITCDGDLQHLEWLLALKNIFARQLPNMPKEYIVRLVFDKHHRSMLALKGDKVFGGCTFRCFQGQEFGEIVFLAIAAQEQVRGYGTRLMNHLKEHAKREERLTHFLTYADNNAIGYFLKQGFTKEIMLERDRWGGFIKDYDGGTLMECALNYQLSYTDFSETIRKQCAFLDGYIQKISKSHASYPGLDHFKGLGEGEYKRLDVAQIPGVVEAGWDAKAVAAPFRLVSSSGLVLATRDSLHSFMRRIHAAVSGHNDSWPFRDPVNRAEVPDYYDVVKDPIDLQSIGERIASGEFYIQLEIFVADFKRMFNNARTYNSPDTVYYKCANRLESFFDHQIRTGISFT